MLGPWLTPLFYVFSKKDPITTANKACNKRFTCDVTSLKFSRQN